MFRSPIITGWSRPSCRMKNGSSRRSKKCWREVPAMSKKHLPDGIRVRWLGHATFDLVGPAGQKFLIDPFLVNNPAFPKKFGAQTTAPGAYHALLVTHPHSDHFEDALPLLLDDPALKVVSQFE